MLPVGSAEILTARNHCELCTLPLRSLRNSPRPRRKGHVDCQPPALPLQDVRPTRSPHGPHDCSDEPLEVRRLKSSSSTCSSKPPIGNHGIPVYSCYRLIATTVRFLHGFLLVNMASPLPYEASASRISATASSVPPPCNHPV